MGWPGPNFIAITLTFVQTAGHIVGYTLYYFQINSSKIEISTNFFVSQKFGGKDPIFWCFQE